MSLGEKLERIHSLRLPKKSLPVLVSREWLRAKGCGQIDLGYLQLINEQWVYVGVEVKSGDYVSSVQKTRLRLAVDEIALHLKVYGKLKFALRQKELLQ